MTSRRDGSTLINIHASGNARPVAATNSIITITENNVVNEGTYVFLLCFGLCCVLLFLAWCVIQQDYTVSK